MGKRINPQASRARSQKAAALRKQQQEQQAQKRAEWWAANRKKVLSAAITAALLIVIIAVAGHTAMQNALPVEIRDTSTIQDNWVVIDTDKSAGKRYHHPASLDVPAGYTRTSFSTRSDGVQQDFYHTSDSPDQLVESFFISAASDLSAGTYISRIEANSALAVSSSGATATLGEPFQHTINGYPAQCVTVVYTTGEGEERTAYTGLFTAFDAPRNVCVYAAFNTVTTTPDAQADRATLLKEAEKLLASLTIGE